MSSFLSQKKCIPCSLDIIPFNLVETKDHLQHLSKEWQISQDVKWIYCEKKFKNFLQALDFVNKVGVVAEEEGHHPNIEFTWGYCKISIQTHKIHGLCENDFILAAKIDQIS